MHDALFAGQKALTDDDLVDYALAAGLDIKKLNVCVARQKMKVDNVITADMAEARAAGITGTLAVKMGGKNMTFSQHTNARPLGACASNGPG